MSFHRVPQWLLGDSISGMDLSLHRKVTTPRGTTRSARQLRQAAVSESPKQIRFPTFIRSFPPHHPHNQHNHNLLLHPDH
ncbi:Testis anion transporter 1 [Dissostichus eleginoides]|uniref:Testis anion transporter 1 n=1 Tax=Dissostichus eleginoides TaxID=100907 RepID=A0AAD9BXW7_DISEL|nr:Testis anion transporter 1 [Dissostichus eleginoides]